MQPKQVENRGLNRLLGDVEMRQVGANEKTFFKKVGIDYTVQSIPYSWRPDGNEFSEEFSTFVFNSDNTLE